MPFRLHLSLYYGQLSEARQQELQSDLARQSWPRCRITAVELWQISADPADWKPLRRCCLTKRKRDGGALHAGFP